jgi:hypothetical protein
VSAAETAAKTKGAESAPFHETTGKLYVVVTASCKARPE